MGDFCKDLKKSDCVNCRLQVAGQDFAYMWKELDSIFVLLFHTYATVQKQKTEVEISVSVFVL